MKCLKCGEEKELNNFYNNKRLNSGKTAVCKKCYGIRSKGYKTPEKMHQYNQTWYKKARLDPVQWDKLLKYQRERYKKFGKPKYSNKCIVCSKIFFSVSKKRKFCSPVCISGGENNGRWKGGRQKHSAGYIGIYSPNHPFKDKNNCVLEHRLVMEKTINRFLTRYEVVHHKDFNRSNNKIENLMLFHNTSDHTYYHKFVLKRDELGGRIADPNRQPRKVKIKF